MALLLARRGWRVCGLDASAAMLAYARGRARAQGLDLETLHGEMERFEAPEPFGAAINPMSSFRLLHSDEAALAHLRRVGAALRPGGVYALDLPLAQPALDAPATTSEFHTAVPSARGGAEATARLATVVAGGRGGDAVAPVGPAGGRRTGRT